MAKKPDDWMPLHIGKYLANTSHLTRDQHGAYLLILFAYWTNGGPIDADDGQLAAMAKATRAEWKRLRPIIARFFTERDGKWHQKRADEELAKAKSITEARTEAGKRGGNAKAKNVANTIAKATPLPSTLTSTEKEDDDDAGALLERVCEILGVQLQADPQRITWRFQIERMLQDGLDAPRIIAAAEVTRTHGKVNLNYLRAIAFNPPKPPPIAGPPAEQRRRLSAEEMDAEMAKRLGGERDDARSLQRNSEADEGRVLAASARSEGR